MATVRETEEAAKYLPHEARVYDRDPNPVFKDEPWPWCPKAALRTPAFPDQDYRDWSVVFEAVPHDAHVVNEGNSWCRGYAGLIPGKPYEELERRIREAQRDVSFRATQLAQASRQLAVLLAADVIVNDKLVDTAV